MKIRYDREEDILTVEATKGRIDHAEEAGPIIVHMDKRGRPLLLEILDAKRLFDVAARHGLPVPRRVAHV